MVPRLKAEACPFEAATAAINAARLHDHNLRERLAAAEQKATTERHQRVAAERRAAAAELEAAAAKEEAAAARREAAAARQHALTVSVPTIVDDAAEELLRMTRSPRSSVIVSTQSPGGGYHSDSARSPSGGYHNDYARSPGGSYPHHSDDDQPSGA